MESVYNYISYLVGTLRILPSSIDGKLHSRNLEITVDNHDMDNYQVSLQVGKASVSNLSNKSTLRKRNINCK